MADNINYVAEWSRIFNQVLGWSPHRTMQWIEQNDLERGLDEYIGDEAPLYWAIPEFIPITLRQALDSKGILTLQQDIWQLYVRSASNRMRYPDYRDFRDDLNRYLKMKFGIGLEDVSANV